MKNIKCLISITALSLIITSTAPADTLLFHAPYDRGFSAETAAGNPKGELSVEEINMETITTFLKQGIAGKALLTGILGEDDHQKRLFCEYDAKNNISIKQGTISFWVKPIDWKPNDKDFHVADNL